MADNFFYRLGYWVATHPKRTLLISIVLVIACCFGFANFVVEGDGKYILKLSRMSPQLMCELEVCRLQYT